MIKLKKIRSPLSNINLDAIKIDIEKSTSELFGPLKKHEDVWGRYKHRVIGGPKNPTKGEPYMK